MVPQDQEQVANHMSNNMKCDSEQ